MCVYNQAACRGREVHLEAFLTYALRRATFAPEECSLYIH